MNPSDTPPSGDDPGVLSGLSRTRPQRRSNKRPGRQTAPPDAAATAESPTPAAAAPRAARKTTTRSAPTPPKKRPAAKNAPAKAPATTAPEPPAVEVGRVAEPRAERPAAAQQHTAGVDLVGQAIQAAGEVAQFGVGIGRQVAKGILSRLPKP